MQKTAGKNTKYSRNETILKIGHLAKAIDFAKFCEFGSKIKMAKNMRKTILQARWSCSMRKTGGRNTKYSRNETILKIGHLPKTIDFAKLSVWVKN